MQVTGYKFREAIKQWTLRRDTVAELYNDSLWFFDDDGSRENPEKLMEKFEKADAAIAKLQVLQARYNLQVRVTIPDLGEMTLNEAVKRVGGVGRIEKMWRSAMADKRDPFRDNTVRNKDEERAKKAVSSSQAVQFSANAAKRSSQFRAAIANANSLEIEMEVDSWLFD